MVSQATANLAGALIRIEIDSLADVRSAWRHTGAAVADCRSCLNGNGWRLALVGAATAPIDQAEAEDACAAFFLAISTIRSRWVHTPSSASAIILASSIVADSRVGCALRTIWVTDSDSAAWRSSIISEKHSAKYGSSANCGKWTDKASARARIQSTDITSIAHHGPSERE